MDHAGRAGGGAGVWGWLLVLCGVLLVWQPLSFALVASSELDAVTVRGLPAVLALAARLIVMGIGIAAGLAIAGRRPGAVVLAKTAVVAAAAMDVFTYTTPYFPSNRVPGEAGVFIAVSLLWYGAWFVYLVRSRRVRCTF